jgi:hypothetical protein
MNWRAFYKATIFLRVLLGFAAFMGACVALSILWKPYAGFWLFELIIGGFSFYGMFLASKEIYDREKEKP